MLEARRQLVLPYIRDSQHHGSRNALQGYYRPCFTRTTSSITSRSRAGNMPARVLEILLLAQSLKRKIRHLLNYVIMFIELYTLSFSGFSACLTCSRVLDSKSTSMNLFDDVVSL